MKFTSMTQNDTYYEFTSEDNAQYYFPINSIILVDDESGAVSVKLTATRKTVGYIVQ